MAGEWISMRVGLAKDPRVLAMAELLASNRDFVAWLVSANPDVTPGVTHNAHRYVTRHVTAAICVSGLLSLWGVANESAKPDNDDAVLKHCTLDMLDVMTGVPGFGLALARVGWAIAEDDAAGTRVRLPDFLQLNRIADERPKKLSGAERTRKWREKQAQKDAEAEPNRDETVTSRVTPGDDTGQNSTGQNNSEKHPPTPKGGAKRKVAAHKKGLGSYTDDFERFWNAYPKQGRSGKGKAFEHWQAHDLGEFTDTIVKDVEQRAREHWGWIKDGGKYVPMAPTYLNQKRWNDPIVDPPPDGGGGRRAIEHANDQTGQKWAEGASDE